MTAGRILLSTTFAAELRLDGALLFAHISPFSETAGDKQNLATPRGDIGKAAATSL